MKFSDPSPSLLDHITLPTESVGLQARRSHSPGVKLVARTFFLSLVIVCSLVVFLISYCASRLRLTGPHDTRRLVDGGADEDTPLLESCSRSPSRSTLSLKSLWAAAPSDDLAGSEGSQAHFLGYVEYPFPRIPGEQNRLTLRKLMRKIYSWRLPHLGNSEKSCSFQTGNINFTVEATEVHRQCSVALPVGRQKISNGFLIKEEGRAGCVGEIQMFVDGQQRALAPQYDQISFHWLFAKCIELIFAQSVNFIWSHDSRRYLVKEKQTLLDPLEATPNLLHLFRKLIRRQPSGILRRPLFSACWAESPTPLADLPGADEGDGAASGTAGVSASRDLRHQPKPAKAGKEGRSPSPSKPAQHLISPQGKYRFARIPGDDVGFFFWRVALSESLPSGAMLMLSSLVSSLQNEQVLEALMEAFHETSLPHRGKRKRRRLLQIGNLYVSVGFVEIATMTTKCILAHHELAWDEFAEFFWFCVLLYLTCGKTAHGARNWRVFLSWSDRILSERYRPTFLQKFKSALYEYDSTFLVLVVRMT
ncbi:hypothetical protein Esti_005915 [Eimeria stiedai]